MKKIYSFVLMAAMLLVGTNAWAGTYSAGDSEDFETAWAKSANEDVVINLTPGVFNLQKILWLGTTALDGTAHSVVINLNGQQLDFSGEGCFLLTHGSLTINGAGTIHGGACAHELFFVTGSNEHATDFTTLKIGQGVVVNYETYLSAISIDGVSTDSYAHKAYAASKCVPAKAQLGYTTKIYTNPAKSAAMGVKVEVDGEIDAQRYCVKTNGDLGYAEADKAFAPFVHIQEHAYVHVLPTAPSGQSKQPLALYASGYARWQIEGRVEGNVGILVKSGDVDVDGATVKSTNTTSHSGANNSNSGSTAQGSAIVISSEDAYVGQTDVTIGGNATITAGKGFALEESVPASDNKTKVDVITVEGATFNQGTSGTGAIIISEETTTAALDDNNDTKVAVVSAVVDGNVTIAGTKPDPENPEQTVAVTINDFATTSVVIPSTATEPMIVVPLEAQLTSDGYASFSAPVNLFKATAKEGYVAFEIYVGALDGEQLKLTEVSYIKAGQAVILHSTTASAKCLFASAGTADDSYEGKVNELKPSTAWASQTNKDHIYCLRNAGEGTMLYHYLGSEMPANKAYLDLNGVGNYAPARIKVVFAETQDVENVEFEAVKAVKFIENGQVLIKRGEAIYNVQGQIVK